MVMDKDGHIGSSMHHGMNVIYFNGIPDDWSISMDNWENLSKLIDNFIEYKPYAAAYKTN